MYPRVLEASWTLHGWEDIDSFYHKESVGKELWYKSRESYASRAGPEGPESNSPGTSRFLTLMPALGLGEEQYSMAVGSDMNPSMRRYIHQHAYESNEGCQVCHFLNTDPTEAKAMLDSISDQCHFQQWACCQCGRGDSTSSNGMMDCIDCSHYRCNNAPRLAVDEPDIAN